MKKYRLRRVHNIKDNNVSIDVLEHVKGQIKDGKLDSLFHLITGFEDIDKQIDSSREFHLKRVESTIDQIKEYNSYLKNKINSDYTKHEIIEKTDSTNMDRLIFTILNHVSKDALKEYLKKPEDVREAIIEKIDPNVPDYLVVNN